MVRRGELAADLTLPKLRRRWAGPSAERDLFAGRGLPAAAVRAVLRNVITSAAEQARDEAGFFARLREAGVLVRVRFSETCPGRVTGYAVGLRGHDGSGGAPLWYSGGRLAADLTLPKLRRRWDPSWRSVTVRSGTFRCTGTERNAIFEDGARQLRPRPVQSDPRATREANQLRAAARLMAMAGRITGDTMLVTVALIANLVALAVAVAELREA